MADTLSDAQKARVLVNGANPSADAVIISSSNANLTVDAADADGNVFVRGVAAGNVQVIVTEGALSGFDDITVTDAPLVVTLDTPVPA